MTHHVPDEILQSASIDVLCYQIKPLVLVQHTDELQNMGMIEAPHYFYLTVKDGTGDVQEYDPFPLTVKLNP